MRRAMIWLVPLFILCSVLCGAGPASSRAEGSFTLAILHNNDGESALVPPTALHGQPGPGGPARFKTLLDRLKAGHEAVGHGVVVVSSGDNILPGMELAPSLKSNGPLLDARLLGLLGYDAIALGNHDFDLGAGLLARLVRETGQAGQAGQAGGAAPFLAANLDVSAEPELDTLRAAGRLADSVVVERGGVKIGIIGLVTPELARLSNPGRAKASDNLAGVVTAEVERLAKAGANIILLASHLQTIKNELELAGKLKGVDAIISGGGHELLAAPGDALLPGRKADAPYPVMATDAQGRQVPIVTTAGHYEYVGELILSFNAAGELEAVAPHSGVRRVAGPGLPDAVPPDPKVLAEVQEPAAQTVQGFAETKAGVTEAPLDGRRAQMRSVETNLGDLIADAVLWEGTRQAEALRLNVPGAAIINGGGVRIDARVPPGELSMADVWRIIPFPNTVVLALSVSAEELKKLLEHGLSGVERGRGGYPQLAGLKLVWDPTAMPGERVKELALANGRALVMGGEVVEGAPAVSLATLDYLARGGDGYPFQGITTVPTAATWQEAVAAYIRDGLGGRITAKAYPEGGLRRVRPEPGPVKPM